MILDQLPAEREFEVLLGFILIEYQAPPLYTLIRGGQN